MDNSSISIKGEKGASYRIDVPMRSINTGETTFSLTLTVIRVDASGFDRFSW